MNEPTMISLRFSDKRQLDTIDTRAKRAGMSRNQYMIRASLGELEDPSTLEERLEDLLKRVERLEHYQNLGA